MSSLSDLAAQCIRCGFCLESCPTFMVTGDEARSPRGRIYLIKSAEEEGFDWADASDSLRSCLGCRACETACPSGVEYGALLELAKEKLNAASPRPFERRLISSLSHPASARLSMTAAGLLPGRRMPDLLSEALFGAKTEARTPQPQSQALWHELDERSLPPVKGQVHLLEGCVMRVLFPRVHQATKRLLRRIGYEVSGVDGGCCGAMDAHAGNLESAGKKAEKLCKAFGSDLPIIVNSAGCGSTMKAYGEHFGQKETASRTFDLSEFLLREGLIDCLSASPGLKMKAAYHDACHLAHGQGIRLEPRRLLEAIPGSEWRNLPESDTCCGSAGTYNVTQPVLARQLLTRKWKNVESTGCEVLVSGNPGCHAWLDQASQEEGRRVLVLHTAEMLEASFSGLEGIPAVIG